MHEFATAQSIIKTIKKVIEKEDVKRIYRIKLAVGELTFLNGEQLKFWIEEGLKGTVGEKAEILVKEVPAQLRCQNCGYEGPIPLKEEPSFHFVLPVFACPKCEGVKIEIIRGRDCEIEALEVD
ncbi:MAG: hydrogenase maturation nickel metallochaperone HypA [candidate division WOR-3 bacterium]